jgi:hypothetical protein
MIPGLGRYNLPRFVDMFVEYLCWLRPHFCPSSRSPVAFDPFGRDVHLGSSAFFDAPGENGSEE